MVAVTVLVRVSITDTVPSLPLVTYAVCADPSTATPAGPFPTWMVAVTTDAGAREEPAARRCARNPPPARTRTPASTIATTGPGRRGRDAGAGVVSAGGGTASAVGAAVAMVPGSPGATGGGGGGPGKGVAGAAADEAAHNAYVSNYSTGTR